MRRLSEDLAQVEHPDLVQAIRDFARERVAPLAAERDQQGEDAAEIFGELARMDTLGITVPEEHGGLGLDTPTLVAAIEELAYADASVASVFAGHYLGMEGFRVFGDARMKSQFLTPMARGELRAAFALTEPDAGSDVGAMRSTAVEHEGGWRLNGNKIFISSAAEADVMLVFAKTDPTAGFRGISAFVVPTASDGLHYSKPMEKMGIRGEHAYEVSLDDVVVPGHHVLGSPGDGGKVAMHALNPSRIDAAALANGIAMRALDLAIAHATNRVQFGRPIRDFQAIQLALGKMDCLIESSRLVTYRAARQKDSGGDLRRAASIAKYVASENAFQVVDAALQVHGGAGYMRESEIERLYRDVRLIRLYEGTSDIQLLTLSKELTGLFDSRGKLF
ncbi:acyl-CoA dehydrogenase family protein [Segeticoccus rhizosphaerae]|uniref:acyl-CoA dehydrogenase family protein n=1 Tax=Segeticoccus rhizosphaerae TaxID=1104777 RepID=UPI00126425EC|nr:acyl-CoA dehydrogenase family protein [Segeticoccus rhizosphaerae]